MLQHQSSPTLWSDLTCHVRRQKIEKKIAKQMEECKAKEEVRFKERLVRMTPSWRALNYDTEEDLAMRLATRREEERMQRESHRQLMESIYGRVHQIPPLFERHARSVSREFLLPTTGPVHNAAFEPATPKLECARNKECYHN